MSSCPLPNNNPDLLAAGHSATTVLPHSYLFLLTPLITALKHIICFRWTVYDITYVSCNFCISTFHLIIYAFYFDNALIYLFFLSNQLSPSDSIYLSELEFSNNPSIQNGQFDRNDLTFKIHHSLWTHRICVAISSSLNFLCNSNCIINPAIAHFQIIFLLTTSTTIFVVLRW